MPLKVDRLIAGSVESLTYTINGQPLSGGGGVTDITYSELYNKIINEELTPGSWYRLTDYKSVNFLNGWDIANNNPTPVVPSFNPREVVTGDSSEVLILQAVSSSEISPIGYSESFPQDIITYLPLVNKIGVNLSIQNGSTLPDSTTVSGFDLQWDGTNVYFDMPTGYPALYGHYFYLYAEFDGGSYTQDGTFEPLLPNVFCQYPNTDNKTTSRIRLENGGTKVVLLDLTEQDYLDYDTDTLYVDHIEALNDAYGWVTRRQDTQNRIDVPFDFRWKTYRRYECEILGNITSISYSATGTTAADGDYTVSSYASTSVDGQNATFKVTVVSNSVTNVEILNKGRLYANGDILTIDGSQIGGVTIDDDVVINIDSIDSNIGYWGIGDVFNGATTTGNYQDFLSLNWKEYNIYNLEIDGQGGPDMGYNNGFNDNNVFFGYVSDCKIGNYFQNNTIGNGFYNNTIETQFQGNTIFGNFQYNTIGDSFNSNTIGGNFNTNTIGNGFQVNTIGNSFNTNTIGINFNNNTIGDGFGGNTIGNIFQNNSIGNSFQANTIGNDFSYNTIGNVFNQNNIGNGFSTNTIGNDFRLNNIKTLVESTDFTSVPATHVYGDYNCEIFRRSDSTLRLSYIDGSDVIQYTAITA